MNRKALWVTETAILLALLVAIQVFTAPLGTTLITGSLVNLVLVVAAVVGGLASGLTVAILSPVFAFMLGIGPAFPHIVLCVMLGNAVLVLTWYFIVGKHSDNKIASYVIAIISAAAAKFIFLYLSVVKLVVPIVLQIPAPKAAIVSSAFSFPQLITAIIGGVVAAVILPALRKAIKSPKQA